MKFYYLFIALTLSVTSFAQKNTLDKLAADPVQIVKCPSVADNYSSMLTKLDTLKASIKKDANCQMISDRLDKVARLSTDREKFLELIEKAKTTPLTEWEIKDLSAYVENVTQKVGNLVELISAGGTCFQTDADKQSLTLLSGFISEAAGLFSQVAGPWGAPIALGGQIISGFIKGLDDVMKNRSGYDFHDTKQWSSYVQNVCTYQGFRADIDALLHPQDRINTLLEIQRKLDQNSMTILSQCPDCAAIPLIDDKRAGQDPQIIAIDAKYPTRIGLLSVRIRLAQQWVAKEITRVNMEANADWNNVTGKTLLAGAQRDMEAFLIDREAPAFINFQVTRAEENVGELNQYLISEGTTVVRQAAAVSPALVNLKDLGSNFGSIWSPSYAPIYKTITGTDWRAYYRAHSRPDDDLEYRLINIRKIAREKFETASWSFGTAYVFCDFFRQADLYSQSLQWTCSSPKFASTEKGLLDMTPEAKAHWSPAPDTVQSANWTDALSVWSEQVQNEIMGKPIPLIR
jgi:hypothetical protein